MTGPKLEAQALERKTGRSGVQAACRQDRSQCTAGTVESFGKANRSETTQAHRIPRRL